jgi:DNA-binding PadR family transcriptional regulator
MIELPFLGEYNEYKTKREWAKTLISIILQEALASLSLEEILIRLAGADVNISEATMRPILRDLEDAGTIRAEPRERGKKYYYYPLH